MEVKYMDLSRPKIPVSRLQNYDMCPQFEYWKWEKELSDGKEASSPAMQLGTATHEAFAQLLLNGTVPVLGDQDLEDNLHARVVDIAIAEWRRRYTPPPWDRLLMVEEPLSLPTRLFDWIGKPDAVVEWQGKLWHLQHKTLGGSTPLAVYIAGQAVSPHEALYCEMLEAHFQQEVAGTMLNVIRKLGLKAAQAEPWKLVHLEFLPVAKQRRVATVEELTRRAETMIQDTNPYRLRAACTGRFGNSLCGFYQLCWGSLKEGDYAHKDPLEYYNEPPDGAE